MISLSVVIVTHKRETLLLNCLQSLHALKNHFDVELILFANGDKLSEKVMTELYSHFQNLTVLEEERTTPGIARNTALTRASGQWVFFIDDDAFLPHGYAEKVKKIIEDNPQFECFGGPDVMPENSDSFQEALAIALASPLCTGPTFRRHSVNEKVPYPTDEKDLTSCHLWVKLETIRKHNIIFAEEFHRGEETTFLLDLAKAKIILWAVPSLWIFHERRKKFSELLRPLFYGGFYRSQITTKSWSIFALPSLMVILHLLLFVSLPLFVILGEIYFLIVGVTSFYLCTKFKKLPCTPLVIVLHYVIVTLYGTGFLYERVTRRRRAFANKAL